MATIEEFTFAGVGGAQIFCRRETPPDPRALILLIHGYAEHSGRYAHVRDELAARGFAVYAPDHRGHGRTAAVPALVERLDDIVEDLRCLRRHALEVHAGLPVFLYGHSMGGLLGTLYLERAQREVVGAVLQGAGILVPPYVSGVVQALSHVLGRLTPKLPVQSFYVPENNCRDLEIRRRMETDPLYYKGRIRAKTGSELLKAMRRAVYHLPDITRPVLVLHGGGDKVVPRDASDVLFAGVSSHDKTKRIFPGAFHELHNEPERERREVLDVVAQWIERHLP